MGPARRRLRARARRILPRRARRAGRGRDQARRRRLCAGLRHPGAVGQQSPDRSGTLKTTTKRSSALHEVSLEGSSMTSPAFVFDAYGTLFDVHAAIGRHRAAAGPDAGRLSELWRTKQLEYTWTLTLAGHYEDFWTLTGRALDFALARFPAVDRALRPKLMDAYRSLDPCGEIWALLSS